MKQEALAFLYSISLATVAFLSPIHGLLGSIAALLLIDFVLGNISAYKSKIPITSKEWKKTLIKFFVYELIILAAFLLDSQFIPGNIIVRIAAMGIGLVECKSIFEHAKILTGIDLWILAKEKLQHSMSSSTKDTLKDQAKDKQDPPASV